MPDELAGNIASKSDRISIAFVKASAGTAGAVALHGEWLNTMRLRTLAEPWLTLHYDEWICVMKARA